MYKVSTFLGESEAGPTVIPLFGPSDGVFEKTAAPSLLSGVTKYIEGLRPRNDAQYVLVNALGAAEYFGCFPAGTLVQTDEGETPIEQIKVGDRVLTHKNRFRPVQAVLPKEATELCDLYLRGVPALLPALTATPNHEIWSVKHAAFMRVKRSHIFFADNMSLPLAQRRANAMQALQFSWTPIGELAAGDLVAEPFPLEEDPLALGDIRWNTPEVAFLMGLYAAEGCLDWRYDRPNNQPQKLIYVTSKLETKTHARAKECAAALGRELYARPNKDDGGMRLELGCLELALLCQKHIGTPAPDKRLSRNILRMPREWQRAFFEAYAGGDGCVDKSVKNKDGLNCTSASVGLLRDFRLLLARLGLVSAIRGRHNTKATWYNGNPIFNLTISGGQMRGAASASPKSYLHPGGYIMSVVKKVRRYASTLPVFDLSVAEDTSYTASGIAVHNSNVNADRFSESALIHRPDGWTDNPLVDRALAKDWAYGFPTFYYAHAFAHHQNKDATRAYGDIELAAWNDVMKRVELVVRVDKEKCEKFGGIPIWDRLQGGQFIDVSMGSRVPWDRCACCTDMKLYREAYKTFDPEKHKHPGVAVLEFHKARQKKTGKGIPGIAVTRGEYCENMLRTPNRILKNGIKVSVENDFPRFFDISFVHVGADRTSKVMVFVKQASVQAISSAQVAEEMGYFEEGEKTASVSDHYLSAAFKQASLKHGEMDKKGPSNMVPSKAVPALTAREEDLPESAIDLLGSVPLSRGLATTAGLGIVLRPREFQRIILIQVGGREKADEYEKDNVLFPASDEETDLDFDSSDFNPALARMLAPLLSARSALGPLLEHRMMIIGRAPKTKERASSLSSEPLRKMGAAYNGYRRGVMNTVAGTQDLMERAAGQNNDLKKLASTPVDQVFTPMSYHYLATAFRDEIPSSPYGAGVQRGFPSWTTLK